MMWYIAIVYIQSYYRLGIALQGLERHEDAMVAFAEGIAIDPKSGPLLSGLTQTMLISPLKGVYFLTHYYLLRNSRCLYLCVRE